VTDSRELLNSGLSELAEDTSSVDLYDRALTRSRQIGRRRVVVAGCVAAAVVLIAIGGAQLLPLTAAAPIPPEASSPAVSLPASPVESPSADAPSPGPSATGLDLLNATVPLPPFPERPRVGPCPAGPLRFTDGMHSVPGGSVSVGLGPTVSADLDADGIPEVVGMFWCQGPGEANVSQVVALRGRSTGALTLMGQVVGHVVGVGDDLTDIVDIEATTGVVQVRVSRTPLVAIGSAPPELGAITQWRTFAWKGTRFTQTGGATTFAADRSAANLTGLATRLVFAPPDGGCRIGEITLTVRNDGPRATENVMAALILPEVDSGECANRPPSQFYGSARADFGTLAPGTSRAVTVRIVTPVYETYTAGTVVDQPYNYFELRTGDRTYVDRTTVVVEFR
jgi:hypothetical protein